MKLKEGDLFKVAANSLQYAVGQIISIPNKESIAILIFEGLYSIESDIDVVVVIKKDILFFANTFDAKFYHKHWIVFANHTTNLTAIRLPVYKLGTENSLYYEDFYQRQLPQTALNLEQKSNVSYRNYVAPIRIENAIKAFYKFTEWNSDYDKLLYKNLVKL